MTQPQHPSPAQLSADPELSAWRILLGQLVSRWATKDFAAGADFVARIARLAEEHDHHPDVDLRYGHVTITTVSHDVDRLTQRDRRLAVAISQVAAELELEAQPELLSQLEVAVDVVLAEKVEPFWMAVLGFDKATPHDHNLRDPSGRLATVWFQQSDEPRHERNRIHLDVTVPHDVAPRRVESALAAGGRLVTDEYAPSWWVLADAEDNEVCVCTWQGREASGEDDAGEKSNGDDGREVDQPSEGTVG